VAAKWRTAWQLRGVLRGSYVAYCVAATWRTAWLLRGVLRGVKTFIYNLFSNNKSLHKFWLDKKCVIVPEHIFFFILMTFS
jgi:hypothetical protein